MSLLDRRLQVLVHPDQYAQLEQAAAARGCSVATIVRAAVEAYLDPGAPQRRRAAREFLEVEGDTGAGRSWGEMKDDYDRDWHPLPS